MARQRSLELAQSHTISSNLKNLDTRNVVNVTRDMVMDRHMLEYLRRGRKIDGKKAAFFEKSNNAAWPNAPKFKFGTSKRGNLGIAKPVTDTFTVASNSKYANLYEKKVSQPSFSKAKRDFMQSNKYAGTGYFSTSGCKHGEDRLLEMVYMNDKSEK